MDFYLLSLFLSFIFLFCYTIFHKQNMSLFDFLSITLVSITPIVNIIPLVIIPIKAFIEFLKKGNLYE